MPEILPQLSAVRFRLLDASLAEHATLSAALAAAQAAEAWLRGEVTEPGVDAPAELVFMAPSSGRPQAATRRSVLPAPAAALAARASEPEPEVGDAPSEEEESGDWQGPTIDAVRALDTLGDEIRASSVAALLGIQPKTAGWRLRQLVAGGLLAAEGEKAQRRYRIVQFEAPAGGGAVADTVEPMPAEDPQADPVPTDPAPEAAPPPVAAPARAARPKGLPPLLPRKQTLELLSVDRVAPELPVQFTRIEGVAQWLRTRDFVITGGPRVYQVDGQTRPQPWLLERANALRAALGLKPFSLGGPDV